MASLIFQFIIALCVLEHALCFDCANSIPLSGKESGEITLPGVGRGNIYISGVFMLIMNGMKLLENLEE
ncbi:hypothetical protein XENTR_v10022562 [Xenopus tropicalis]|nr:hypothetical protein XENTR_v10022562 [Xenopus tropicalis]